MLEREGLAERVEGKLTRRGVRLTNGSVVELLSQSERSVRGQRVQKLRCDEVELFDRDVWEAAQFVTRSAVCGEVAVRGSVEALSTAHRPFGLMKELVQKSGDQTSDWELFRWNALDVMGGCEATIECADCVLWDCCGGRARAWRGFLPAADVLSQRKRSSKGVFDSEMLCAAPSRRDVVYEMFDVERHVVTEEPVKGDGSFWIGGMDFGVRNPFVMLWAQVQRVADDAGESRWRVVVFDEYVEKDGSMLEHREVMESRRWGAVRWAGVDPAGNQREQLTGQSVIGSLRDWGWRIRTKRTGLEAGLEVVRKWLEEDRLVVHARCGKLIESLSCYHFDSENPRNAQPVKDGYDHAADALRYMLLNLGGTGRLDVSDY
jgi:hypothetical protein